MALLNNFPEAGIAGVTLETVRDMLGEYTKREEQYGQILELLTATIEQIADEPTRESLKPIHEEIKTELSVHTLTRMADFLRLADDSSLKPDQKVSLAISGWLLGSGEAIDNLAVATSLVEVRNEVRTYLQATRSHERDESLEKMRSLEGGSPGFVAKLIANIKPPIETQASETGVPGLFELTVPGIADQAEFTYYVQLPLEYNPYRRYPCVVTLNGAGSSPQQQIDWWAGGYNEETGSRHGQASRHGYIVLAPKWQKPHQRTYEFSLREHAAVLFSLRDAIQRMSIDTDRVFLSGHSIGGDAAWDIALAHPDLWAGLIPIVANADRYIRKYTDNGRTLPMYFVGGERDGGWLNDNGAEFDRYLRRSKYDITVVQYLGRGHEHFQDEIQRIFEWMELSSHRRNFMRREIEALTMRPWDNYFWWLEIDDIPKRAIAIPEEGQDRKVNPIRTKAVVLESNRIKVSAASGRGTVWLSPEMLSFEREIVVSVDGRELRDEIAADIQTILEDVRTRGDRQHPFWAKIDWPERRSR
jgi:predicted esterase